MIPLFQPNVTWREALAVGRQVLSGWVGPGKMAERFEQEFAESVSRKHAVAVSSGTTGLFLCLKAMGVGPGDTVAFPAYGFVAGANAAKLCGATVRLVDVDLASGCMDYEPAGDKAAIFVDHNGYTERLREACHESCDSAAVNFIEDACTALGCPGAGSQGHLSVFSFSPQKLITTGQGGMIVTDDDGLCTVVRQLRDHGEDWRGTGVHRNIGGNFRLSDVQAAMGLSQLRRLSQLVRYRQAVLGWYEEFGLPNRAWERFPASAWCAAYRSRKPAEALICLRMAGIGAQRLYLPMFLHPPFQAPGADYPNADRYACEVVYLPTHLGLNRRQVRMIANRVRWFEGTT